MGKNPIFNQETDIFFVDRWNEKIREEGGRRHPINHSNTDSDKKETLEETEANLENDLENNEAIEIYLEMLEAINDDAELKPLLDELEKTIIKYTSNINRYQKSKAEQITGREKTGQDLEESDYARRLAHDSMIASLSALSRAYVKKHGVNMWRYKIDEGRGDRKKIAEWAKKISPIIQNKRFGDLLKQN